MPIKWGGTTVTAVKWGNTQVAVVYWGSTIVFPGYGGKILYNGNTFYSPLSKVYVGSSSTAITSGSISVTVTANGYSRQIDMIFDTYIGRYPTDGGINLSSYSYLTIEYVSTNTSMIDFDTTMTISKNLAETKYYAPIYNHIKNSFITYNISGCTFKSGCGISGDYLCQTGTGNYTITVKKIIGS